MATTTSEYSTALLQGLDAQQRVAATAASGPVCILAGAGTGKTRTITHRIAYRIASGEKKPTEFLAVTFTVRAAAELRERVQELLNPIAGQIPPGNVQVSTFHAAALRQLRYFWPRAFGEKPFQILDNTFRPLGMCLGELGLDTSTDTVRDVVAEVGWAKASCIAPGSYVQASAEALRNPPIDAHDLAQVFSLYESKKAAGSTVMLDFDDVLSFMSVAIEEHPEIREEFSGLYNSFIVDEFQDVTPRQAQLLDAWRGKKRDITVVGDTNQTIYSFAGAQGELLHSFAEKYGENAVVCRLENDYRSTPQIVDIANEVISKAPPSRLGEHLQLIGQQPAGQLPVFKQCLNDEVEADYIAASIKKQLAGGHKPGEICVLYRINSQSERIENALSQAGIDYLVRGGERFFERAEIASALTTIRQHAATTDITTDLVAKVTALLHPVGLTQEIPDGERKQARRRSLLALVDIVSDIVHTHPDIDLAGVSDALAQRAADKRGPTSSAVTLSTIHAAKGLEWDSVYIMGAHEGMLPFGKAANTSDDAVEEERRLFYVALTRPRFHAVITWSQSRGSTTSSNRSASRFVKDISIARQQLAPTAEVGNATCRECASNLTSKKDKARGRCRDCAEQLAGPLHEALTQWRNAAAEEMDVPRYVVLSNATIDDLASQAPTTITQLGNIRGIGRHKLDKYADQLLAVISHHT